MACFVHDLPGQSIHNPAVPTHFVWLQVVGRQVSVYRENLMLASTTVALRLIEVGHDVLEPVLYLPRTDICAELEENGKTTHCPLKGDAIYFDLIMGPKGENVVENAAWAYESPFEFAARLKGRVAFDCTRFAVEAAPL